MFKLKTKLRQLSATALVAAGALGFGLQAQAAEDTIKVNFAKGS